MPANLVNALLFVFALGACLFGGNSHALWLVAIALLLHLGWTSSWAAEGKLLASCLIAGTAVDSFLLQLGVFEYSQARLLIPLWQASLWLLLGTALNHSLAWSARPWWLASLTGAIIGASLYCAAQLSGQVHFPYGSTATLLLVSVIWAVLLPVLHGFATLYRAQFEQTQKAQQRQSKP